MNQKNTPKPEIESIGYGYLKNGTGVKMLVWSFNAPIISTHGGKEMFAAIRIETIPTAKDTPNPPRCLHQTYYELPFTNKQAMDITHKFSQSPEEFINPEENNK